MVDPLPAVGSASVRATQAPSFVRIYREYAPRVARWAVRLGGPDCDPEDLVQEIFLVVSRKLDGIRDDGNLASWLFAITRRIAANQRRRLRWRRLWAGSGDLAGLRSQDEDPDAVLERRRMVTLFHRALDQLPEKQRTVFVLYELEGQSTAAIAELTQRNHSTVKVQLSRARERFIASYQRLLRRDCADMEKGLAQLAERVVVQDTPPIVR